MANKAHYLAIDKCPHGTVALSINNGIGGTRLTGGCCGSWATQRVFPVDVDSLVGLLLPYAKNDELTALRAQVSALQTERDELTEQSVGHVAVINEFHANWKEAERQAKHWRDQHANEVKRAKIIKDTGDVPLQRIQAYERMGELQGQVERLTAALEDTQKRYTAVAVAEKKIAEAAESERDQLRAEVKRRRDGFIEDACNWRGIDIKDACPQCCGSGVRTYGSTSTWQGGIGGQMMTPGVCDMCWGSGDKHRHGANLRKLRTSAEVSTSYEKGAESMRGRVLAAMDDADRASREYDESWHIALDAIRALPLKENEG